MLLFRISVAVRWAVRGALALVALLVAGPVAAQSHFLGNAPACEFLVVGYQFGQYSAGAGNLSTFALELNRAAASVQTPMTWSNGFRGVSGRMIFQARDAVFGFGWTNRHTIHEARYTDAAGQKWRTSLRERLDALSLEVGLPDVGRAAAAGRLARLSAFFRVSQREGKDDATGSWHTFHDDKGGLLSSGRKSLTAALTVFVDLAPIGKYGGGLTLRPYWQVPIIQPFMFGRYGTRDSNSYQYRITNFGLSASWAFTLSHPKS